MIYHLTSKKVWDEAQMNGQYTAPSLFSEKFIHCSTLQQLKLTWKRYYNDLETIVLVINEQLIGDLLVYEFSVSVNEEFPHIYAPIELNWVTDVVSIKEYI